MIPELKTSIPGPRSLELAARLSKAESRNVTFLSPEFPVFWERATGTNVWDVDGNRFLDLVSSFGVVGLGHGNDAIREALLDQSGKLIHAMGDVHPAAVKVELCEKLSAITFERWNLGRGKTILGNSGSEAIEAALKTSMMHSSKPGVIAFHGAYHGLGLGALEVCGIPYFRTPFKQQLAEFGALLPYPSCYRCPHGETADYRLEGSRFPNCSSSCLEKLRDELEKVVRLRPIGCVLVEPIQSRGGEIVPPLDFLRLLREFCDQHKILLIYDEILTGFNRTGSLFAADFFQTYPDILCLSKGLTSGFPLSACVGRSEVMDAWPVSPGEALHTSTYLGHPLGCRMAVASITEHEKPAVAAKVRATGAAFKAALNELRDLEVVGDVRGAGLMLGVELIQADGSPNGALAGKALVQALHDGFIVLAGSPNGNVLTLTPPFDVDAEEIAYFMTHLRRYLAA